MSGPSCMYAHTHARTHARTRAHTQSLKQPSVMGPHALDGQDDEGPASLRMKTHFNSARETGTQPVQLCLGDFHFFSFLECCSSSYCCCLGAYSGVLARFLDFVWRMSLPRMRMLRSQGSQIRWRIVDSLQAALPASVPVTAPGRRQWCPPAALAPPAPTPYQLQQLHLQLTQQAPKST